MLPSPDVIAEVLKHLRSGKEGAPFLQLELPLESPFDEVIEQPANGVVDVLTEFLVL